MHKKRELLLECIDETENTFNQPCSLRRMLLNDGNLIFCSNVFHCLTPHIGYTSQNHPPSHDTRNVWS